ncbi:MAG: tetratricopeptide repeat protein [Bacteroidota bacterium]
MKGAIFFITHFCLTVSCNFPGKQNVSVKQLTDSATSITKHYTDTTRFNDAIKLFDQAIFLDSNDLNSQSKKYFLEFSLGQFKEAEKCLIKIIMLRPDSAELYAHAGFFQEFRHDTIESKKSFAKAILLYKTTLDTMDRKNPYWMYDWKMSAICTIMAGQEKVLRDFLKEHVTSAFDSSFYDIETLTKTKEELLESVKTKYSR